MGHYRRGLYDNLPEGLTKERIDQTAESLKDKIANMGIEGTITYGDPRLTTSLSGEMYVKMEITITPNEYDDEITRTVFLNI